MTQSRHSSALSQLKEVGTYSRLGMTTNAWDRPTSFLAVFLWEWG